MKAKSKEWIKTLFAIAQVMVQKTDSTIPAPVPTNHVLIKTGIT
jgi:hypothetical protein